MHLFGQKPKKQVDGNSYFLALSLRIGLFAFLLISLNPLRGFSQSSLNLTGSPQWVRCGDLDVTGTQMTIEATVYNVSGGSVDIISKHTGPANVNYLLRLGSFEVTTTSGFTSVGSSVPIALNQCYHLAATYDGSFFRYYVNGCETGSVAWNGNLVTNNLQMAIGNMSNCQCEQFFGYIDEVRIWNVCRSQAQIEGNMDNLPSPTTQGGLLAYYDFETGFTNLQGNAAFNGTPIGGASRSVNPNCGNIPLLNASATSTPVACNTGGGTVTGSATGAIAPYQYSLDGGAFQGSATFTSVPAGNHVVTVNATNGCTRTANVSVTDPGPIVINPSQTNISCNGANNGTITIAPSGGTLPYTITWTPNTFSGTNLTSLPAGNYSVTVTDPNGCSQTQGFQITEPSILSANVSNIVDISCFGANDGSANASAFGGMVPYSYLWDNGETTQIAVALGQGSHSVTVTDNNGCPRTPASFTINEPTQLQGNVTVTQNVSCFGGNNGAATVNISGGISNYTIAWPNGGGTPSQISLAAGNAVVNITDANGCTAVANYTITEPSLLTVTVLLNNNVSCNGGNDGSATATGNGGTPAYTYSWSNGFTGATPTNLAVGNPNVTATDANGCTALNSIAISEPIALTASIVIDNPVSCAGLQDGQATVTPAGGTAPYFYLWNNGATTATTNSLSVGPIDVDVLDNNGCTVNATNTMTEPSGLSVTVANITDISCFGADDGGAIATPGGGTAPFSYLWANGETIQSATALVPGSQIVALTDANGCTVPSPSFTINEPTALQANVTVTQNALCFGSSDGTASVAISGGTPNYTIAWPSGTSSANETGLAAGNGTVNITDANGCTATANYSITEPTQLSVSASLNNDVSCNGGSDGSATATGAGGTPNYTFVWSNGFNGATANNLTAGNPSVTVTDANGCTANNSIAIAEPTALTATITIDNPVGCAGGSNGQATANPLGGTAPYNYLWNDGETSSSASNLSAGNINVDVTDSKGCTVNATNTMTEPLGMTVTVSNITNITCNGLTDGSATVNVVGGSPAYIYLWDNNENGTTAINLGPGTSHYVGVVDQNGCTKLSATFTITEPTAIQISLLSKTNISCFAANDGTAEVTVTGGTPTYTYAWPNAQTTNPATNLSPGIQTVTVTDANNCQATFDVTISQPQVLAVTVTLVSDISCFGADDGQASSNVTGGTPPFTYLWSSNETTANSSALAQGQSVVDVTDANGCTATSNQVTVAEPPLLTATITSFTDVSCFGFSDGQSSVSGGGGTPPYTYSWSDGETTQTASNLPAGSPIATVTDGNGCTATANTSIGQPMALVYTASGTTTICIGQSTNLNAAAGPGQPPLTFDWSNSFTGPSQSVSPTTTTSYTVSATDGTCTAPDQTVTVTVRPPLTLFAFGDASVCDGTSVQVWASGGGGDDNLTYTWDNGLAPISGPINFPAVNSGPYVVTLTDGCGTPPVTDTIWIYANPFPDVSFTSTTPDGCQPLNVAFTNTSTISSGQNVQFEWRLGGQSVITQNPSLNFPVAGSFDVELAVVSDSGCRSVAIAEDYVVVHPNPTALFTPDPYVTDQMNTQVLMVNQSTGAVSYEWFFQDSTYTGDNPVIDIPDTGVNYIQMIATSEFGCTDETMQSVYVNPIFTFYVPKAFTVNQDRMNEVFSPKGVGIREYEMKIFDRWGGMVYRTKDLELGWDGTISGTGVIAKQDVYTYDVTLLLTNGVPRYYRGYFSLLR